MGFFLHAVLEILVIKLMLSDFEKYSLGLSWNSWMMIHTVGVGALIVGFSVWGNIMGKRCWKYLYIDGKSRWGNKLKKDF